MALHTKWLPPSLALCWSLKSAERLVIPPLAQHGLSLDLPASDEKAALQWVIAQLEPAELPQTERGVRETCLITLSQTSPLLFSPVLPVWEGSGHVC